MLKLLFLQCILMATIHTVGVAQNNRITTYEKIGWYGCLTSIKLNNEFGIHAEYQWRRDNYITDWLQGLLRVGVNYHATPKVLFRVGYALAETYPYGEIPINALGRDFTEHRIFEMAQISHNESILDITHRFMLEQRFVGRYSSASVAQEDEFPLLNRVRYMLRLQMPLAGNAIQDNTPYLAAFDEVMIGFGENVNANIFDQNRIGVVAGYRFIKSFRIEAGYINQIVQFGRQLNGKNIFQNNSGVILSAYVNVDLSKPE